jgi:RNA 3'-phosphate cyclase
MIKIDGSYGEGGGQILRIAVALSAVTGNPVNIYNIRKGRPKPGLARQHISAVRSVAELCNATVKGLAKGSTELEFYPSEIVGNDFQIDIGTAGAITLVLQAFLLPALIANRKSVITISGGTDVPFAPPIDYFKFVFLHHLGKLTNASINIQIISRGYYPKGGGRVRVEVNPGKRFNSMVIEERGELKEIHGIVNATNLPYHILKRMKHTVLKKFVGYPIQIEEDFRTTGTTGTGIVLWARTENTMLGASALGKLGVSAETVGISASNVLLDDIKSNATVDLNASDQLIPYLMLADGKSIFKVRTITKHTETIIWLTRKFVDRTVKIDDLNGLKTIAVL